MSIGQFRFAFLFGHHFELIAGFHRSQANVLLQIVSLAGFHSQGQKAVVLGLGAEVMLAWIQREEEVMTEIIFKVGRLECE